MISSILLFFSFFLTIYALVLPPPPSCASGTCFISPDGSGDCTQANPCSIVTAFGLLADGNTINAVAGTYLISQELSTGRSFTFQGAGIGQTILLNSPSNNFRTLTVTSGSGVTFRDATFSGASSQTTGSLISINNAGGNIFARVEFTNLDGPSNVVSNIVHSDSTTFLDCTFSFTTLTSQTSAILVANAPFNLTNCIFMNNTVGTTPLRLQTNNAMQSLTNCRFFNNIAGTAGAIYVDDGSITVTNTIFENNAGGIGGAIYVDSQADAGQTYTGCTFRQNLCFGSGGAINFDNNNRLTITSSTFDGNILSTINNGAAIFTSGPLTAMNVTFRNHNINPLVVGGVQFTGDGGAIFMSSAGSANAMISDCTFENNNIGTNGRGAAIFLGPGTDGMITSSTANTNMIGNGAFYFSTAGVITVVDTLLSSNPVDLVVGGVVGGVVVISTTSPSLMFNSVNILVGVTLNLGDPTTFATLTNAGTLTSSSNINITNRFNFNGGTLSGTGTFTLESSCTSIWEGATNILATNVENFGTVTINGPLGTATTCVNIMNTFTNMGTTQIFGSSTNPCTFGSGTGNFINMGTLRAFGVDWSGAQGTLDLRTVGTTFFQLGSNGIVNGIFMGGSSSINPNGVVGFERIFPFWPVVNNEIIFLINTPISPNFNATTLNLQATIVVVSSNYVANVTATPFTAGEDLISTEEDTPVSFNPLINDFASGGNVNFDSVNDTIQLSFNPTTSLLTYTPSQDLNGVQSFSYVVNDGSTQQTANIIITIDPVNDPPTQPNNSNIDLFEIVNNVEIPAVDIDSSPPQLQVILLTGPNTSIGIIEQNGVQITDFPTFLMDPNVVYTVNDGEVSSNGIISYQLTDGEFTTGTGTLSLNYISPADRNNSQQDNTAAIVGGVVGAFAGCICLVLIASIILYFLFPGKKRGKKALENFLARSDLPLVLALIEVSDSSSQRNLALYFTQFFSYHKANFKILSHFIAEEITNTDEPNLLFRENSFPSKLLKTYAEVAGTYFLKKAVGPFVNENLSKKKFPEVDPSKLDDESKLEKNQKNFIQSVSKLFDNILKEESNFPQECRDVCSALYEQSESRWPQTGTRAVSSFIFLRWLSPAMLAPKGWGLAPTDPSPEQFRNLVLHAKVLQAFASENNFGGKEKWMEFMNPFLKENAERFKCFLQATYTKDGPLAPTTKKSTYDYSFNELHKYIINKIDDLGNNHHMKVNDNMNQLNKILIYLGPPEDDLADIELENLAKNNEDNSLLGSSIIKIE